MTLAAEGRTFVAHKLVLSACSPYLRDILERNPCKHPVVFLRGVSAVELHLLLQYIYRGEAHVRQDQLPGERCCSGGVVRWVRREGVWNGDLGGVSVLLLEGCRL